MFHRHRAIILGLVLVLASLGTSAASARDDLPAEAVDRRDTATLPLGQEWVAVGYGYVTDNRGYLYGIELPTQKVARLGKVAVRTSRGVEQPVITDLALAPGGELYGISFSALYRIDQVDPGRSRRVGVFGTALNAAAFSAHGRLYAASSNDDGFYELSLNNGRARLVGQLGHRWVSDGDLALVDDTMYGTFNAGGSSVLATIDLSTGRATPVAVIRDLQGRVVTQVYGLIYTLGDLWAFTGSGRVLSLSPADGSPSQEHQHNAVFWGACRRLD